MSSKTKSGNYFEDFRVGQEIVHATPRTVTEGDVALYTALFGPRFAVTSSAQFASTLGLDRAPIDSLLAFHIVFGKRCLTSPCRVASYASGRWSARLSRRTFRQRQRDWAQAEQGWQERCRLRRSIGVNARNGGRLHPLGDGAQERPEHARAATLVPSARAVGVGELVVPYHLGAYDTARSGSPHLWEDTRSERIDHVDGMTIEEAEHMMAACIRTRRGCISISTEKDGRFGRRIIYGGHIINLARSLSFNGLANALNVASINAPSPIRPSPAIRCTPGQDPRQMALPGRADIGALRVPRSPQDRSCPTSYRTPKPNDPSIVLDFDYTVLMRQA
jgi:2-methylfumaryl-CoA hydratase